MRDFVMHYITEYIRREFIPWLDKKGVDYTFLFEEEDTKDNFEKEVIKHDIIILAGHGQPNFVTGYGYQPIVKACNNDVLLFGKVVSAVACLSGRVLGQSAVNKGAKLYIGYVREALLITRYDTENPQDAPIEEIDPLSDDLAYPFLDTMFYPAKLLIEGVKVKDLYPMIYDRYKYWIDYALSKQNDDWNEVAKGLIWNRDSLVIYPIYEKRRAPALMFLFLPILYLPLKKAYY